jgi:hypothetical protein
MARVYARRGFSLPGGERCGDHDLGVYLAQLKAINSGLAARPAASFLTRPEGPSWMSPH